jgi:hypothetical protein
MAQLPAIVPSTYLDEDTDSVFQARVQLKQVIDAANGTLAYLYELFGWQGDKATAIATLFNNQAVLFPTGTTLWFHQHEAPPGWVQHALDIGRYLMAVPDQEPERYFGTFDVIAQSTPTTLTQAHLPAVNFFGASDWQGDHAHTYAHTIVDYTGGSVSFERDANGPKAWARYETRGTGSAGVHNHGVTVSSGGSGWAHAHDIDLRSYRPAGITGILARKV